MKWSLPLVTLLVLLLPSMAQAQDALFPAVTVTTGPNGATEYSVTMQILLLMTCLLYTSPSPRD